MLGCNELSCRKESTQLRVTLSCCPPYRLRACCIPATQIQNSNAEIPNAEIPNPKSQIMISIFCRNPKSQIPNTSNLCILVSQIPNYLGFGQHGHRKYFKDVDIFWHLIERRHTEASSSVIQSTTDVFKNSIESVNSSINNVNSTVLHYNEELKSVKSIKSNSENAENVLGKKQKKWSFGFSTESDGNESSCEIKINKGKQQKSKLYPATVLSWDMFGTKLGQLGQ
ncbi:hypothetical protein Glove_341g68 [Diversispora epigaea]|uniref:Uncharacterized protein n=1 Tax=Diversispora epigaea TaxID=1348612 RepID=A0A397HP65_9GLOM|nr:hypothetical protein Glove_341g68 [Diversispora epigaea]